MTHCMNGTENSHPGNHHKDLVTLEVAFLLLWKKNDQEKGVCLYAYNGIRSHLGRETAGMVAGLASCDLTSQTAGRKQTERDWERQESLKPQWCGKLVCILSVIF